MIGIVLISHGGMADGMISTASMLCPNLEQCTSLTLWPEDNPDDFQEKLTAKVAEVDTGEGVLILADLLGGTPCNRALYLLNDNVRILAGLSLPMLVNVLIARLGDTDLDALAAEGLSGAAVGTVNVGELLKNEMG